MCVGDRSNRGRLKFQRGKGERDPCLGQCILWENKPMPTNMTAEQIQVDGMTQVKITGLRLYLRKDAEKKEKE